MKALKIFFILFGVLPCGLYSQVSDVGIGEWRSHLPYEDAIALAEGGNRIYCASVNGLFYYDKSDNSVGKLTKVNGLSGVAISTIFRPLSLPIRIPGWICSAGAIRFTALRISSGSPFSETRASTIFTAGGLWLTLPADSVS
jgi:hypothetical protein